MALNIKFVGANPNNYQAGRGGKTIKYVVCHWIVGTLESADTTFQNPDRIASATYGIGDIEIHQYVKETDTSYANDNFLSNQESITIEHEGGWLLPDKVTRFKPTDETHETSARLIADICKRYNIPIDRQHIKKHSEVSDKPTACCGLLDIDRIVKRAKELSGILAPPMVFTPQTKIPINTVAADEVYGEVQLDELQSKLIAKGKVIKAAEEIKQANLDLTIANNLQAKHLEQLNVDLTKTIDDFRKYKATHPETPTGPETPPITPPVVDPLPSSPIADLIKSLLKKLGF